MMHYWSLSFLLTHKKVFAFSISSDRFWAVDVDCRDGAPRYQLHLDREYF